MDGLKLRAMHWCVPIVLFAATLVLYLAFPTRDLYWDGAGFALVIDHPGWFGMIEPNHPIYIGFAWVIHALVLMAVPALSGLTLLQTLNSILGAIAVAVMYGIGNDLFADRLDAVLLAGMFALSATWWKFTTDSDAYIPSVLMLLICAWLLLPGHRVRPIVVALVHTCAMLFHELAALFFVVAVAGIYMQNRGNRRTAMRSVAAYLSLVLILSSAAYYVCFYLATGQTELTKYLPWITWHTPDSSFSFALARNTRLTLRGTLRLFVGGRIGAFHSGPVEVGVLLALLAVGAFLVWRTGTRCDGPSASRPFGVLLGIWIAVYGGFLFFWLPENTFYRLFYLPPAVLLIGIALRHWGGRRAMFAVVGLLGAWNYLFYIHPHSLAETNTVVSAAMAMRSIWKPGTWVYQGSFNADNWTVFCLNPQVMFKNLDRVNLTETARELEGFEETGHETWIDKSGIDSVRSDQVGKQWLTEHTRPGFKQEFSDAKHKVVFDRLFP